LPSAPGPLAAPAAARAEVRLLTMDTAAFLKLKIHQKFRKVYQKIMEYDEILFPSNTVLQFIIKGAQMRDFRLLGFSLFLHHKAFLGR
jgi:hypothetical protein